MKLVNWVKDRIKERTSWDGGAIIVVSVLAIIASPIIKWVAGAGLIYGVITIIKKD
jgi:hypothetical protein